MVKALGTNSIFSTDAMISSLTNLPLLSAARFSADVSIMRIVPMVALRIPAGLCLARTCRHNDW